MSRGAQRRRLARLEQPRCSRERLRVVERWPGDPAPEVDSGELLVVLRRFGARPQPAPASASPP